MSTSFIVFRQQFILVGYVVHHRELAICEFFYSAVVRLSLSHSLKLSRAARYCTTQHRSTTVGKTSIESTLTPAAARVPRNGKKNSAEWEKSTRPEISESKIMCMRGSNSANYNGKKTDSNGNFRRNVGKKSYVDFAGVLELCFAVLSYR
jgi:hypothetical protein